jgi:phage terminase Nu1 subunit (DNA packaging protein)
MTELSAADFEGVGRPRIESPFNGLTKEELASATGFTVNQITGFARDGMPGMKAKGKTGVWRFDLPAVVQWLANKSDGGDELSEAKRKTAESKARMSELDLQEREGKLVDADHVNKIFDDFTARVQSDLMTVCARHPAARDDIEALINRHAKCPL